MESDDMVFSKDCEKSVRFVRGMSECCTEDISERVWSGVCSNFTRNGVSFHDSKRFVLCSLVYAERTAMDAFASDWIAKFATLQ